MSDKEFPLFMTFYLKNLPFNDPVKEDRCKLERKGENTGHQHFYAPASKDLGHIIVLLSACPSICLHKLNVKT